MVKRIDKKLLSMLDAESFSPEALESRFRDIF